MPRLKTNPVRGSLGQLLLVWGLLLPVTTLAQQPPGVRLAEVEERPVYEETRLNGTVSSLRASRLSASVAGLVSGLGVDVGDRVGEGDTVVTLDDEQARHALTSARARQQEAEASLAEARRRVEEARSVGAGRNIARTELSARESELAVAEAALASARAELSRFRTDLERHRISAPFEGVVSSRSADIGEWVTPGDELMTLVDPDNLRLDFQVGQDYFGQLNDDTELLLTSHVRDPVTLEIASRVPVTDPASRPFLLRATAPVDTPLMPGMSVSALLRVSTGEQGLTVPRDALNRYPEGRVTVWVAEPAEEENRYTVTERRVETGAGFRDQVEVAEGLEAGQRVVSRGNEALDEGMTVRVSERSAR
ncbi:efflux RND transporter periplasmic adaptor subunit [Marinobacter sp.]|uniref:efflux RND transporter periplasmic adaptor subunit n=1 Tax=Marinobacter sp. TaxID=50741 RepID=UPI003561497E